MDEIFEAANRAMDAAFRRFEAFGWLLFDF